MLRHVQEKIKTAGGWLPFSAFMHEALYAPGLGYYAAGLPKLGLGPADGSDFVTAPELSPYFGRSVAAQVAQVLQAVQADTVYEFGAGTGRLAEQVLGQLQRTQPGLLRRYVIVEVSPHLRGVQAERLAAFGAAVQWADTLPETLHGVVLGNEVLDAMPVDLLLRQGGQWQERGVALAADGSLMWQERATALRPPLEIAGGHDYLTEIHPQAAGFVRSLCERLSAGMLLLVDYGFGEREYYHPQRAMGTLMCHQGHRADDRPLEAVGLKDITAHINFTDIAVAAQEAGAELLGYSTQGQFLIQCGLLDLLAEASLPERVNAQKLIFEHEMGELFKVIALGKNCDIELLGFAAGDRSHTL